MQSRSAAGALRLSREWTLVVAERALRSG
jgi:hypothetical protein